MDLVLRAADEYLLDSVWARLVPLNGPSDHPFPITNASMMALHPKSAWPRDYIPRQLLSITAVSLIGMHLIYFVFACFIFRFLFNHELMKHPHFRKNQIKLEIQTSLKSFPAMVLLSLPWLQAEIMGYSQLYDDISERGWLYFAFSIPLFFMSSDFLEYWIHRALHRPMLYKRFHKHHHQWIIPTPFASHAFHPVEGHLVALSFHIPIFLFPLHRGLYVFFFVFANIWGVIMHDTDMDIFAGHPLERFISGPTQHALHHRYFTVNYGQYFTWVDHMGGTYLDLGHPNQSSQVTRQKTK